MINISYKKNNKGKPEFKCESDGKEIYFTEKSKDHYELISGYIEYLNEKHKDKSLVNGREFKEFFANHVDEYLEHINENW